MLNVKHDDNGKRKEHGCVSLQMNELEPKLRWLTMAKHCTTAYLASMGKNSRRYGNCNFTNAGLTQTRRIVVQTNKKRFCIRRSLGVTSPNSAEPCSCLKRRRSARSVPADLGPERCDSLTLNVAFGVAFGVNAASVHLSSLPIEVFCSACPLQVWSASIIVAGRCSGVVPILAH